LFPPQGWINLIIGKKQATASQYNACSD